MTQVTVKQIRSLLEHVDAEGTELSDDETLYLINVVPDELSIDLPNEHIVLASDGDLLFAISRDQFKDPS